MIRSIVALFVAVVAAPNHAAAQATPGIISGTVLDASTDLPLSGSTVTLRLAGDGSIVSTGGAAPSILAVARQTVTGDDGHYRFTGLAPARYELRAHRMGYLPGTVVVELRGDAGSLVSLGLSVVAVRLQPVPVNSAPTVAFNTGGADVRAATPDDARVRAARARQRAFTGTDVRELTDADVLEAVTLGETDILRALQRLPGVDTFGDYSAELWTRGGRWDQTRVYFDGVPLFAPMHTTSGSSGGATISGFGSDVIGGALLFPGVRPASIGEGGAAVLDLRSRPAMPDGDWKALAELTLLSGRLALSRGARDGRSGWSFAGRHALLDIINSGAGLASTRYRQYFDDVTGRWEHMFGSSTRVQLSGLFSRDVTSLRNPDSNSFFTNSGLRNTAMVGVLARDVGHLRITHRAGMSELERASENDRVLELLLEGQAPAKGDTSGSRVLHLSLAGEVEPVAREGIPRWRAGYELTHQRLRNRGFARQLIDGTSTEWRLERQATLPIVSLWGEYRWPARSWLLVDAGLRVESGGSIQGTPAVRPLPRLQLRAMLDSATSISAGVGRSYLYAQATPTGFRYNGTGSSTSSWRLADDETPALRSDIATLGVERWAGTAWLLSATAYARRSTGVLLRDLRLSDFSPDIATQVGTTRARGIELSARRLAGRLTASAAYTIASAQTSSLGLTYPADEERPRSLDATALFRATSRLQLGAAFMRMSGRRYTSSFTYSQHDAAGRRIAYEQRAGERNALRGAPYESLDLLVDWSGTAWGARTGLFLQFRNVTGRRPAEEEFTVSGKPCTAPAPWSQCSYLDLDLDGRVAPFMPLLGIRVTF